MKDVAVIRVAERGCGDRKTRMVTKRQLEEAQRQSGGKKGR